MIEGLFVEGPDPELNDKLMLFGQFVGDWEAERRWINPEGEDDARNTGTVHFSWIRGGRATQDVWTGIDGDPPKESAVGTAIRFYDPETDAWVCVWVAPLHGVSWTFSARRTNDNTPV